MFRQVSRGPAVALKPPLLNSESDPSAGRPPDCVLLILGTRGEYGLVSKLIPICDPARENPPAKVILICDLLFST